MDKISGVYSRTNSYEQVTAPSSISDEFYYRFMPPDANNLYDLTPGETYTLSGSVSHTAGELKFRSQYSTDGSSWVDLSAPSDLGIPVSDGSAFTSFSHTFTVPDKATGIYISLQNYDYTAGSLFRFKNMKLEKGSVATNWCLSQSELTTTTGSYRGVTLNDRGLTATAGGTTVAMNSNDGFLINNPSEEVFHVDTNGNLTMRGNIIAGNISGVTLQGDTLTLQNSLKLTGDNSAIASNNGDVIFNKNGISVTSGLTTVNINGTNPLLIQNNNNDIFKVDSQGNVAIKGDLSAGDSPNSTISGINFTGQNLTLSGSMKVNGQILFANSNGVLSSQGLSLKGGGLSISDDKGNQTTYVTSDGTFTTKKGFFSGTIKGSNIILKNDDGSVINANGGTFMVDGAGRVTAKSLTLTGNSLGSGKNSASLSGVNIYKGSIIEGSQIIGNTITGNDIYGGHIIGAEFRDTYIQPTLKSLGEKTLWSGSDKEPTLNINNLGIMSMETAQFVESDLGTVYSFGTDYSHDVLSYKMGPTSTLGFDIGENMELQHDYFFLGDPSTTYATRSYHYLSNTTGNDIIIPLAFIKAIRDYSKISFSYYFSIGDVSDLDRDTFQLVAWDKRDNDFLYNMSNNDFYLTKLNFSAYKSNPKREVTGSYHVPIASGSIYSDTIDVSSFDEGADIGIGIKLNVKANDNFGAWWVDLRNYGHSFMLKNNQAITLDDSTGGTILSQSTRFDTAGNIYQEAYRSSKATGDNEVNSMFIRKGEIYLSRSMPDGRQNNQLNGFNSSSSVYITGQGIYFANQSTDNASQVTLSFSNTPGINSNDGQVKSNGYSMDAFGNIHGGALADTYNIYNRDGSNILSVPFNPDKPFEFNVPQSGWGGLKIGWVKFDDWNTGPVPAIYNDKTHLSGIAIWDRNVVLFVDGWAWNMTDKGLIGGVNTNNGNAVIVGTHALNKDTPK